MGGVEELSCNRGECTKRFPYIAQLREHWRLHDNILTYCHFCPWTGVKASRSGGSEVHWNTHFRIKAAKCSYCDERFYEHIAQLVHEEGVHDIIEDRYKCKLCDFTSFSKPNYFKHKRTKH